MPSARKVFEGADFTNPDVGCGNSCGDGCGDVFAVIALVLVAALLAACSLLVAWLLVELALPLVFTSGNSALYELRTRTRGGRGPGGVGLGGSDRRALGDLVLLLAPAAVRARVGRVSKQEAMRGQHWNDYLRERLRIVRTDERLEVSVRSYADFGFLLTNWEIARRIRHPQAAQLQRKVLAQLPTSMTADPGADWRLWPGLMTRASVSSSGQASHRRAASP